MSEKSIELTENDIQIDWWKFEKIEERIPSGIKQLSQKYYAVIIQLKKPNIEIAEQTKRQILTIVKEYPKLKEYQNKLNSKFRNDVIETIQLREQVKNLNSNIEKLVKDYQEIENLHFKLELENNELKQTIRLMELDREGIN